MTVNGGHYWQSNEGEGEDGGGGDGGRERVVMEGDVGGRFSCVTCIIIRTLLCCKVKHTSSWK